MSLEVFYWTLERCIRRYDRRDYLDECVRNSFLGMIEKTPSQIDTIIKYMDV